MTETKNIWELIVDPALDGETNMAVDSRLLEEVESSNVRRTIVRFYSWINPTVSLGRNQKKENAVDLEFCSEQGINVVYRPTGGRAVLHDDELTYAIASNDVGRFDGGSVYATYRRISEAMTQGYRRLGVDVALAPDTKLRRRSPDGRDDPCFISPSRYELMFKGRKIAGSAQRQLRRGFLQHGSILITCNRELLARATRLTDQSVLNEEMAGVAECLPERPSVESMVSAFKTAFIEYYSIEFKLVNDFRVSSHWDCPPV